jgi:hypothetical protein
MKFDEKTRGYIYRVLIAAGVIVAAYGLMSADQVAQWVGLAAVVLNIMPTANTSVKSKNEDVIL